MINFGIQHAAAIGLLGLGFLAGVMFAAWRQLRLEKAADDEWVASMKRQWKAPA